MSPVKPSRGVDCHAHVFSALAPAIAGARYRPAYAATLAAWQAHWPAAGITHGVLVQPSFFGTDNSEMLAALAADRPRLRGVAVVDPRVDDDALRRMHAAGVRALRLNLRGVSGYAACMGVAWCALIVRAHALGWHLEIFADAGALPAVIARLDDTPIAVLFDHFAVPGTRPDAIVATFNAIATLALTRPVWGKLSAPYRLEGGDPLALAARWLDLAGPGSLVWGSDWPWTAHESAGDYMRLRNALDRWVGAAHVDAVLWDNAARLYDFRPVDRPSPHRA